MSITGSIVTGAIGVVNPAAGLALKAARGFFEFARQHWKAALAIAAALVLVVGFLILRGEIRHRDKIIANQAALIAQVKAEVDRGVGQPTRADQAPIWIRRFVDNVNVLDRALDREAAALQQSHVNGQQARTDTIALSKTTPLQQQREKDRHAIVNGTGALTADDWSKL